MSTNHAISDDLYRSSLRELLAPIIPFLEDPSVSEVMINGHDTIYVERSGKLFRTAAVFADAEDLVAGIRGIAQFVGRHVDALHPRLDARLPDGSRVHAILEPAARRGAHVAIRKFSDERLGLEQLVAWGSLTDEVAQFLGAAVRAERNIIVAGGTGSGKTSLLNVLSSLIPAHERIIVIEDSSELKLHQDHVVYLEARPGDPRGKGRVTIKELFWSSMRLRPDRIVIGELRGGEALDLVQAMTSGHGGSMSTTHATVPEDTLRRIETMALMSDVAIPHGALREQVASAVQLIVQTSRFNDGRRGVTHVSEVRNRLDANEQFVLDHVFVLEPNARGSDRRLVGTGHQPAFLGDAEAPRAELAFEGG